MTFQGLISALITPFKEGKIDKKCFRQLVDWQIAEGVDGILVLGTTGESPTIKPSETQEIITEALQVSSQRVPIMVGTGTNDTSSTIKRTHLAQELHADAALLVTPYYNKPSQEGLYQHFKTVHDATSIPLYLYNIPARTHVDITVDTMARLSELPRIYGVKDSTSDLTRPTKQRKQCHHPFIILWGDDHSALPAFACGAQGVISVCANVTPKLCKALVQAALNQDFKTALQYHETLFPLFEALFLDSNPSPTKYALSLMGKSSPQVRQPLIELSQHKKKLIQSLLKKMKIL